MAWLPSLFQSREPIVRAAALSLAAGIATTAQGCNHIMNMLTDHSDVWMTPLWFASFNSIFIIVF